MLGRRRGGGPRTVGDEIIRTYGHVPGLPRWRKGGHKMRKALVLAIAVSLVLIGGAFTTAQAQTGSNTCYYEGCSLEFNTSPCSWALSEVLPWNWNWSALSPCNWRSACGLKLTSEPTPAGPPPVAEASSTACHLHWPNLCHVCAR